MARPKRKAKRQQTPVIKHPLFPAVVSLWFGALFGLGSLAIRTSLIEALVLKLHVDTVISAAAPPLGVTARITIALAMAVFGGLLGAKLAGFLARPRLEGHQRRRGAGTISDIAHPGRDSRADAPARRPISAHEEFGGPGIESAEPQGAMPAGRRRALAIDEGESRFKVHDFAPLPCGAQPEFDAHELDLAASGAEVIEEQPAPPLDFSTPFQTPPQDFGQPVETSKPFDPPPAPFAPPQPVAPFAPAVEANSFAAPGASAPDVAGPAPAPQAPLTAEAVAEAAAMALDSLGLVELTERFAASLRRRRAELAAGAASVETSLAEPAQFEADEEIEGVEAAPATPADPQVSEGLLPAPVAEPEAEPIARFAPVEPAAPPPEPAPMAMPAALRPLQLDLDESADEDFATYLPLRQIRMPDVQPTEPQAMEVAPEPEGSVAVELIDGAEVEPAEEAESDGYSSLLDLGKPAAPRQEFVRIEEPEPDQAAIEPVVIFPGQAARHSFAAPAPAPFAAPAPAAPFAAPVAEAAPAPDAVAEVAPLRRFDAPANAHPGQPVAAAEPVQAQDPAETERALRAALATLQRMSGAA